MGGTEMSSCTEAHQHRPNAYLSIVGFKDRAHYSACPKPQAMKDETPHCHRAQAAAKLTHPDVSQEEGWQGPKRRRLMPTMKMLSMSSLAFSL